MEDDQDLAEDEYYSDDPVLAPKIDWFYKLRSFAPISILLIVTTFFLPSTIGGRISLNSGTNRVEFGQAVRQSIVCAGSTPETSISVTPYSKFVNATNSGTSYFGSVRISGNFNACTGNYLAFSVYSETGITPLALFNTSISDLILQYDGTTFVPTGASPDVTVTGSAGNFLVEFANPAANAGDVAKIVTRTIGANIWCGASNVSCKGLYSLGGKGMAGGVVFYASSTPFTVTGSVCNTACHYLEFAPQGWESHTSLAAFTAALIATKGVTGDPRLYWFKTANQSVSGANRGYLGIGLSNTLLINSLVGTFTTSNLTATGAVRAYKGGDYTDWFIGSGQEILNLISYVKTRQSVFFQKSVPTTAGQYWSSTSNPNPVANQDFSGQVTSGTNKNGYITNSGTFTSVTGMQYDVNHAAYAVRPIRAF